jgi:hypothetical protein
MPLLNQTYTWYYDFLDLTLQEKVRSDDTSQMTRIREDIVAKIPHSLLFQNVVHVKMLSATLKVLYIAMHPYNSSHFEGSI